MGFLAPSALFFGLLAIPVLALYLLRVRGRERRVSSTFLWRHVVHDIEANTLWQRLRPSLLLFLQLLALAALVFALAGPYFLRASGIEGDLILVLDAGRVVERGTHDELLAREGWYAGMHRKQLLQQALEGA